jgi:hypothetical protein
MKKNILCVKWGNKYDDYVEKLKTQIEQHCSYDFNFYCLTDNPQKSYDLELPTHWDSHFNPDTNSFWAYRKCYMFNEDLFPQIEGDEFLFLDLDILIHKSINPLLEANIANPRIVRGWWNDIENCRKNFGKGKSPPLNSSVIRWNRGQLLPIYNEINENAEYVFFTYNTIDNYFNQRWYNVHDERDGFFRGFAKGLIYSWYKGNIYPEDMFKKVLREDHIMCLFNNSASGIDEDMSEVEEIIGLY